MRAKAMSPRERLLAAMRCEQPDRVPIQVRGVYPTDPTWLARHHESFRPLFELVRDKCDPVHVVGFGGGFYFLDRGSLEIREETVPVDADWVDHVTTVATPRGPLVQVDRVGLRGDLDYRTRHFIRTLDDLEKVLSLDAAPAAPATEAWFETVRRVGDRALPLADIGMNPVGMAHNLMGSETLALWSATDRDALRELLRVLAGRWQKFVGRMLDAGVGGVFTTLGHEVCLPPLQSPADFREFVVETDQKTMQMVHERGNLVHVHCHSDLNQSLDGLVRLGVNCLHPVEAPPMGDIELADAKRRLAGKICIEGNLQIGDLQTCTPDEIRRATRRILSDAAAGGGLILCPTASPHWPRLSGKVLANYRAFIETGLEFGRY